MPSHVVAPGLVALLPLTLIIGCSSKDEPLPEPTFWQDVAPIMMSKCVTCHQKEGIGHFPLDDYETARQRAASIDDAVQSGRMPPFLISHDGSCGDFQDDSTLTTAELDIIHRWASGTRAEGTPDDRLTLPPVPVLDNATEYRTPSVTPLIDPTNPLGANDEYRCYEMEPGIPADRFITGYQIIPGNPAIVHHVAIYVVKPSAPSYFDGRTNGDVMAELDALSPDRPGWDCFGAAGDGVAHAAVPVTWAPGQNVVEYPRDVGLRISPDDRLVIQMHYNVHEPGARHSGPKPRHGGSEAPDSTLVRLRYADSVKRSAMIISHDPFIASMFGERPDSLPPGQKNASYTWNASRAELDILPSDGTLEVLGVMPHMHERGRTFEMRLNAPGREECVARVDDWDFHWQSIYWYRTPPRIDPSTSVGVTCTFDTRDTTSPVLPGWGTDNEMCLSTFMVAPPATP
ncbi:hypothetical protein [Chondromyces crocatus]|uniref:Copper type II ascorbate-dependent monooxygenase C-terminal domain-containing protein n=1 Tax=Chondromyces crocatus TaxID=52 RepID=A0A0K1EJ18_CHOCO|nr:hypothetical protein [Chondromyces crocatus]AKT40568.1 uncharacterized protein CMC5_047240 [Chondromyces crocatus]